MAASVRSTPESVRSLEESGGIVDHKLNRLGRERLAVDDDLADGDGKRETARTGTAGIHEQHTAPFFNERFVGMPRHDRTNTCGSRLDVKLREIVYDVEAELSYLQELGFVEALCPRTLVVVSSYGSDRRDGVEFLKNTFVADVTSVDDEVAALQELLRRRPEETVSVGNEAYANHERVRLSTTQG